MLRWGDRSIVWPSKSRLQDAYVRIIELNEEIMAEQQQAMGYWSQLSNVKADIGKVDQEMISSDIEIANLNARKSQL